MQLQDVGCLSLIFEAIPAVVAEQCHRPHLVRNETNIQSYGASTRVALAAVHVSREEELWLKASTRSSSS
jgi:hypothetical protein